MSTPLEHDAGVAQADEMEVKIRGLMMDPVTNMPMVVLKDIQSDALVPIWVGIFEANAIALEIEKTAMPRQRFATMCICRSRADRRASCSGCSASIRGSGIWNALPGSGRRDARSA